MSTPGAPAAAGGMPQFDMAQWPGQIAWALIIFAVLYVLFWRVFLPRLSSGIAEREDRISGEIGEARRMRDDAHAQMQGAAGEMAQARARARQIADEAAEEARQAGEASRAEADARFAATLAAAEERIAQARGEAMSEVHSIAAGAAAAMIERLSGAPVAAPALERALGSTP